MGEARPKKARKPLTDEQKTLYRERAKAKYHANRESILKRRKALFRRNPEKYRATARARYRRDPEKVLERNRRSRMSADPQEHRAKIKAYYQNVGRYARRKQRMGDRHCATCGILMASKYVAIGTKKYCDSCIADRKVRRQINTLYRKQVQNRKLGLPLIPIEFPEPEDDFEASPEPEGEEEEVFSQLLADFA